MSKKRVLLWILLFLVASLLGYLDALGTYAQSYSFTTPGKYYLAWNKALIWDLAKWNLWVLLAPPVLWLGRETYLERRPSRISAYALIGICFAVLHSALLTFIQFFIIFRADDLVFFLKYKYFVLIFDSLTGFITYGLILVSGQALSYYKQAREGELKSARLETQLAQAQLQALKMQLQPHFLFNALHSISSHLRDAETARRMITRLGDFLRLTLTNAGSQEITLKEELEFLRCYLDIESTRFRDRLVVEMEIEPETWDARLPNLILQPIVENAIKHGIEALRTPGRIDVRARRSNGSLQVQIQDNGCGLQSMSGLQVLSEGASDGCKEGVGLKTTRARLEHLYRAAYRLKLNNVPEGGLLVTLEVPFKIGSDEIASDERPV